ncbi:MAG: radical SAM protein [Firmicutes bacterium]|nr:radical SAM protein [Candidatus Caballimonas caccae]
MNLNNICSLCPNKCKIDKNIEKGLCGTDNNIRIAKFYLHKFEEPCISGENGSGTIFFSGCSLKCVFCQNYEVSRATRGKIISVSELVDIFKKLEDMGAENINLVTPTHYSNKIIEALSIYKPKIPVVYNTHGYETIENLKEIDKFIDIYLPDIKYHDSAVSKRYSGKENYFGIASKAIEFMVNKPIIFDQKGIMKSGTIVRHLVLPMNTLDSKKILDWFSTIKDKAYINVMSQYTPFGNIGAFPELKRKITKREYETVIDYAISLGIEKMFYQKFTSQSEIYIPKWDY